MDTYYSLLNIPTTATADDIRRAYQKQALATHPDRNNNTRESVEQFQRVADAYIILSDPARRAAYDSSMARASTSEFSAVHTDAESVFGDAFEEMLRPEVPHPGFLWWLLGMFAGLLIGLIIANIPGMILGAWAGGKLGSIRDNKGKPVAQVFGELKREQKYQVLEKVARRVLSP
jgi:hypothetical protein